MLVLAATTGYVASTMALPRVPASNSDSSAGLVIASFDGTKGSSYKWAAENDPVMGGQSVSTFTEKNGVAVWKGEVKIVPFLHAPGFCTCRTEGAKLPDISSYAGMSVTLNVAPGTEIQRYQLQFSSSVRSGPRQGEFQANFNLTAGASGEQTIYVPFAHFKESFRGEPEGGAPTKAQLAALTQIGIGSDGIAGKFNLEIKNIAVGSGGAGPSPSGEGVELVTFGEKSTTWKITNDPVMGGLSHSTFVVDKRNATGLFKGEVKIVPKLKAPGFCNAETNAPFLQKFADASGFDALEITLKSLGALTAFKSSFGTRAESEFGSYKAGFNVTAGSDEWQKVVIPWTSYTNKWSDFTGGCTDHGAICCSKAHPEVCPTQKALASISNIGIWGEGTAGEFELVIKSISAVKISAN